MKKIGLKGYWMIVLFLFVQITAQAWTGDGTSTVPYEIRNASELRLLNDSVNAGKPYEGIYFKVTNSFTLTLASICIGTSYAPFRGNFDGGSLDGNVITGMTSSVSGDYFGLFGYTVDASIQNIDVQNLNLTSSNNKNYGGCISGYSSGTSFNNCKSSGSINGREYLGGIVGYGVNCSLNNCSSSSNVTSTTQSWNTSIYIGGLVGYLETTLTVSNCSASGNLQAEGTNTIGGLIGYYTGGANNCPGDLTNCYREAGSISGNKSGQKSSYHVSALFGQIVNNSSIQATITDCYVTNVNVNTCNDYIGGIAGSITGPFSIKDCHAEITMESIESTTTIGGIGGLIGYANHNNIDIENCYAILDETSSVRSINTGGLIGSLTTSGIIKDCYAISNMAEGVNSGGLIGYGNGFQMENCFVRTTMQFSNESSPNGGLIGRLENAQSIKNCYSEGTFSYNNNTDYQKLSGVGGLIGNLSNISGNTPVEISNCFSTIYKKSGSSNVAIAVNFGGLIGIISNADSRPVKITSCYYPGLSELNIMATNKAGCFIGIASGNISVEGCYSTGNVSSLINGEYAGGIIASGGGTSSITYSVAAGDALTTSNSANIARVSSILPVYGNILNLAYQDMTLNGNTVNDSPGNGTGKSWEELTDPDTYTGMGNTTWTFESGGNWKSGKGVSLPYAPRQSSPVKLFQDLVNGGIIGIYNTIDTPDEIRIYNYTTDTDLGTATFGENGLWSLDNPTGTINLGDYIIARSITAGRVESLVGLYLKNIAQYSWYRSVMDGYFDEKIFQGSLDQGVRWTSTTSPMAINRNGLEKVIIRDNVLFEKPSNDFTFKILSIEATGKLNFTSGNMVVDTLEMISNLEVTGELPVKSGQLIWDKPTGDFEGSLSFDIMKVVKSNLYLGRWYHMSMPFGVSKVTNTAGDDLLYNNNDGYYAMPYDGLKRATNDAHDTSIGINWIDNLTSHQIAAHSGFQSGSPSVKDLVFLSSSGFGASSVIHKKIDALFAVTPFEQSYTKPVNKGWNFIGNPFTSTFNLRNIQPNHICYVYQAPTRSYTVVNTNEDYWIDPFSAFFVQTEGNSLTLESEGMTLRSSNGNGNTDEVSLLLSNPSFSDRFRVGLNKQATSDYDLNKDAVKMLSNLAPQLYSTSGNIGYAINVLPYIEGSVQKIVIPLSYYVPAAGAYTISYQPSELSSHVCKLVLKEKTSGKTTDLLLSPTYSFSTGKAETNTSRFELEIEFLHTDDTSIPQNITDQKIDIILTDKGFYLTGLEQTANISLHDITGKLILQDNQIKNYQVIHVQPKGMYVLKLHTESQRMSQKIILR